MGKVQRARPKLTEAEWRQVFQLRCRSKRGERLSTEDFALTTRAYHEDANRYSAMDADVFDATVPFGSGAKSKR